MTGRKYCSTSPPGRLARTRGTCRTPVVLDTSAAAVLGYVPAGDYAATVTSEVDWLVRAASTAAAGDAVAGDAAGAPGGAGAAAGAPGGAILAVLDGEFFSPTLDYAAEDRYYAGSQCG